MIKRVLLIGLAFLVLALVSAPYIGIGWFIYVVATDKPVAKYQISEVQAKPWKFPDSREWVYHQVHSPAKDTACGREFRVIVTADQLRALGLNPENQTLAFFPPNHYRWPYDGS